MKCNRPLPRCDPVLHLQTSEGGRRAARLLRGRVLRRDGLRALHRGPQRRYLYNAVFIVQFIIYLPHWSFSHRPLLNRKIILNIRLKLWLKRVFFRVS